MLEEFFAVTQTSVYHIKAKGDDGHPSVVKIALHGDSTFPIGHKLRLTDMVSVGSQLIGYIPERHGWTSQLTGVERNISRVSTNYWGDQTSPVVALFEKEADAKECFNEPNLKPCDPRWIEQTRRILDVIGEEHPVFFVPHDDLALLPVNTKIA